MPGNLQTSRPLKTALNVPLRCGRVASWRLSFTTSSIYDSEDLEEENDCDYSVSEISESFTFR